jgi:GNAT superfamily N-acetyltransferase
LPRSRIPIRSATAVDVDALVRLHLDTVGVAYRGFFPPEATAPDPDVLAGLWRRDLDHAHDVLVASDDSAVVGSVVARAGGELARLHVHPTRWRSGLGRRLHDAAVEVLRAAGHRELGLWVIEGNAAARSLYESAGWRLVPGEELVELGVTEVRYRLCTTR